MITRLVLLLIVFLSVHVGATTYYVAKTGNDGNPGTEGSPLLTIQAGVNKAYAGDLVMVLAGTYNEQVSFPRSGTEGSPIVVRGDTNTSGEPVAILDNTVPIGAVWSAAPEIGSGVYKRHGYDPQLMLWKGNQIIRISDDAMNQVGEGYADYGKNILNYDSAYDWHPYTGGITTRFWPDVQMIYGVIGGDTAYIRYINRTWNPDTCDLRATEGTVSAFTLDGNDYITLDHLWIQGYDKSISLSGSSHNTISNCVLRNGIIRVAVTFGSANNTIKGNDMTVGYGPYALLGEWGDGQPDYGTKARRTAQYALGKFIEGTGSSVNYSVQLLFCGAGNVIDSNYIHEGNIGVWSYNAPQTTVSRNVIEKFSSVGYYLDIGMTGLKVYDNDLDHNNISFRIAGGGSDNDTASGWFYNNRCYNDTNAGMWLKWFPNGYDTAQMPRFWFYHNSVAGFEEVMTSGEQGSRAVNNIFSTSYLARNTSVASDSTSQSWYGFDYNFLGGLYKGNRYLAWAFYDRHNQASADTMYGDVNHQVWPLGSEPNWIVPDTSTAYRSGLDLSDSFTIRGTKYGPLPGMTPGYFTGAKPNLGAVQNTLRVGMSQRDLWHGSVTQLPELAFAPNPVTGRYVTVRCAIPTGKVGKLALRDVLGRAEKSIALVRSGITQLDLRSFAPGIYIAALDAGGPPVSRKLIITAH